jgi:hypothetical protein
MVLNSLDIFLVYNMISSHVYVIYLFVCDTIFYFKIIYIYMNKAH